MDIEGAEIGALRGLRRTIAQSPGLQLIMEYNPQALKAFGHDPAAAFDEVLALGFTRAQIVHEDGTLSDVQRDALAALTGQLMQNMGVVNVLLTR
jgi:hypothetical protein